MDEVMPNQADLDGPAAALQSELDRVRLRTQYLEASNRVLSRENEAFRQEIGRQKRALVRARTRAKKAEREVRKIRSSRSWKLASPVRATGRALRRMKHGSR